MADWEAFVEWELDNDFLATKASITVLQHTASSLRWVGGGKCNKAADSCDVAAHRLRSWMFTRKAKAGEFDAANNAV